jgi:hypothetical protein
LTVIDEEDNLKHQIQKMEQKIPYLKGKKKMEAKEEYLRLLKSCGKNCKLIEPIYLRRK